MDGPDSIPKFFNPEMPPTPGGWHYWLDPERKGYPVNGPTAQSVFSQIKAYLTNNRRFRSDEALWAEIWKFWCSQEPKRCGGGPATGTIVSTMPGKEVWGPILWKMLNWAAVNYEPSFFNSLVESMRRRLIPCPECRAHFEQILDRRPLVLVNGPLTACRWVNDVHNDVNEIAGKPLYPYARAAAEYGFPIVQ